MLNRLRDFALAALLLAPLATASLAAGLPASLILEQGKLAKYPTPAEGPGKWGVSAADFSVLTDQELVRKAGLPGAREKIQVGAQLGDAYAQYLMGAWILLGGTKFSENDGWMFLREAQKQGVVRAVTHVYGAIAFAGRADSPGALAKLAEMAATGNAFSIYAYGITLHQRATVQSTRDDAILQIRKAAEMGYAPAKELMARLAASKQQQDGKPPPTP